MLLHDYLEYFARETPDHLCVEMDGKAYSYAEANRRCNQIAHACISAGMKPGDRLVWLSKNSIDIMLIFYAASKVGVVPVPLNYRLAPAEWRYIIDDCDARVLVCEDEYCPSIDTLRDNLGQVRLFLSTGSRNVGAASWQPFDDWIKNAPAHNLGRVGKLEDDLYQMYTSGTTGRPKGAVLSQGAINANIGMIDMQFGLAADSRFLLVLPLYHSGGSMSHKACISRGGSVIIQREFDPLALADALQNHKITNCALAPAMIQATLVRVPGISEREFPHLRVIVYGASPIAVETLRQAMGLAP